MKQFTYNGYYFLEVPINSFDFFFLATGNPNLIGYYFNSLGNKKESGNSIELPPGDYTIIGLSKDITEEQWREIVEMKKTFGYREYDAVSGGYQWCATPVQSGLSLLRSKQLSETNTLVLKIK